MDIEIDGSSILTEQDFHEELAAAIGVREFYGYNLDALWDLLSAGVERPVVLRWKNSELSRRSMGNSFHDIIKVLERVKSQDISFGWPGQFVYFLE
jgi:ribonuclease inhibitor